VLGDVVKKLVEDLDGRIDEDELGDPFLSSHNYRTYPLDVICFNPIKTVDSRKKFAFVDGGNQALVEASNFSIQLNRIYFNMFAGRRSILPSSLPQRMEFFSVTSASFRSDQIFFDTSLHLLARLLEEGVVYDELSVFD
jgi:hypothetical protein